MAVGHPFGGSLFVTAADRHPEDEDGDENDQRDRPGSSRLPHSLPVPDVDSGASRSGGTTATGRSASKESSAGTRSNTTLPRWSTCPRPTTIREASRASPTRVSALTG